jgi:hypothetical protein
MDFGLDAILTVPAGTAEDRRHEESWKKVEVCGQ